MIATSFPESNHVLDKPSDMSHEECEALSVWVGYDTAGTPLVISCWKLAKEELEEINRTGRVYLQIVGRTMPPVSLTVARPWEPLPTGEGGT